jgi:hypothetical protein
LLKINKIKNHEFHNIPFGLFLIADPKEVVLAAREIGVGLYGFTKPTENSLLPSMDKYLTKPIDSFEGDEKNIATLVRSYKGLPLDYIEESIKR